LEYLSFYFSKQPIDTLKLNCVEIIFNFTDNELQKRIHLPTINGLVEKIFDKESLLMKKRKNQNQGFDLFVIANRILILLKQNRIPRRICKICSRPAFHFIKVPCCKTFICTSCIISGVLNKNVLRCKSCENECLCRNVQEFSEMFKSTCVAIREISSLEITKEKENEWENEISKMRKLKKNVKIRMKCKKFAEIVNAHENDAMNSIVETERKLTSKLKRENIYTSNMLMAFVTCSPQMYMHLCSDYNVSWILLNMISTQIIAAVHGCYTDREIFSKELNQTIRNTNILFVKFFLSWINFLFVAFFYGPNFCEHPEQVLWILILAHPICWLSRKVSDHVNATLIHESVYEFY